MWRQFTYNSAKYARFILRRDRIRIPVWIIALLAITLAVVPYFHQMSTTGEAEAMAQAMNNPAVIAMVGPAYGLEDYHTGAMMAHQMLLMTAFAVAVMSIMLVVRHTRADEEQGRLEMFRSLPVGRLSNLNATLLVMFAVNVVMAVIFGLSMYAMGIESMDFNGSMLYGAALGATGFIFAAITAFFAQLTETSRGAMGYSFAALGVLYVIRGIGDVSSEALSWTSPLGWIIRTETYVNNYWWPIVLTVGAGVVISAAALYLNSIRDLDAGFIAAKPGPKHASFLLRSPLGLASRLQKGVIIGWGATIFLFGASYGSVLGDVEEYFATNELVQRMLPVVEGYTFAELFLTMLMFVLAVTCAIPVVLMVFKLKGEESNNRTEPIYARAVSRTRMLGSYLLLSLAFGAIMLFLSALGLWSLGTAVMETPMAFTTVFNAAMVYLPAMWIMTGLSVLVLGVYPQFSPVVWIYLGYSFFVTYFGGILQFPEWVLSSTHFSHIPQLPTDEVNFTVLIVMTLVAVALTAAGLVGYRRRDIQG